MLYLFLNIIMKMLEFTFLNPNIYYRTIKASPVILF